LFVCLSPAVFNTELVRNVIDILSMSQYICFICSPWPCYCLFGHFSKSGRIKKNNVRNVVIVVEVFLHVFSSFSDAWVHCHWMLFTFTLFTFVGSPVPLWTRNHSNFSRLVIS